MRRTLGVVLAITLIVVACGDDDGGFADPASLDTCEEVADASIAVLQKTIDIMDEMPIEELLALSASEETPEAFQAVEEQGIALEARTSEIGCNQEEFNTLVADRASGLTAESGLGQVILEAIKAGDTSSFFP